MIPINKQTTTDIKSTHWIYWWSKSLSCHHVSRSTDRCVHRFPCKHYSSVDALLFLTCTQQSRAEPQQSEQQLRQSHRPAAGDSALLLSRTRTPRFARHLCPPTKPRHLLSDHTTRGYKQLLTVKRHCVPCSEPRTRRQGSRSKPRDIRSASSK